MPAPKGNVPWNKGKKLCNYPNPEETFKRMSLAGMGRHGYWNGKKFSEEHKQRIGQSKKGNIPWMKGKQHTEQSRKKQSEARKKFWAITPYPIFKRNGINKAEIKLQNILEDLFPGSYKYVGDGQFIIAGKNPDFININGQKKIIELYGIRWHAGEDRSKRINLFRQYGYDTFIVEWKDLRVSNGEKKVRNELVEFHRRIPLQEM